MPIPPDFSVRLEHLREAIERLEVKIAAVESMLRQLVVVEPATRALRDDFTSIQMAVRLLARDIDHLAEDPA